MEQAILAGTASPGLASALAACIPNAAAANRELRRFPDGEIFARVDAKLSNRQAYVIQSWRTDADIIESLVLCDAAREAGAASVGLVVPYLGYARQDRAFNEGEAISSRAVLRAAASAADRFITVDPHKLGVLAYFGAQATHVSAIAPLAEALAGHGIEAILAPDAGARDRAEAVAARMDVPFDHLEKRRVSATEVTMAAKDLDVAGRRVAIVDDMIASGGTMRAAVGRLKEQGATQVTAACTHGVFTNGAVEGLLESGMDRVLCTDTLEGAPCDVVSVAAVVGDALR